MKRERLVPRGTKESRALTGGVLRAFQCCEALNKLSYADQEGILARWSELTGRPSPQGLHLVPPFRSDHGYRLEIGVDVFINHDATLNDMGGIMIGDDTMLGPHVSLLTGGHPTSATNRRSGLTLAPITLCRNVWVGAGATILGGVTLGDGAVVAAGAVVTHDVEPASLVAGVPARFVESVP